jgi:dCMP deaminase
MKERHAKTHMKAAYLYSQLSYCKRKQVGCVIVKGESIIAIGYNGTPPGEDNCCEDENNVTKPDVIHAEDNALRKLTKSHESAVGASVFVTLAPCKSCASRLVEAGIDTVYYSEIYRCDEGIKYLKKHGVNVVHLPLE